MGEKILIIGAGISGLSAGCYGQMNGFDTEIFETSFTPGGGCTGIVKKGYYFDTCTHWVSGVRQGGGFFNRMWRELGALDDVPVMHYELFAEVTTPQHPPFLIHTDADAWGEYLTSLSPKDSERIGELTEDIKRLSDLPVPDKALELLGIRDKAYVSGNFGAYKKLFAKYARKTVGDISSGFESQCIREGLRAGFPGHDYPALSMIILLGQFHGKNAGWLKGGALAFAKRIAERYENLKGKIHYGKRVKEVVIEKNRAVGVRLDNESFYPADIVISAVDGKRTILEFIDKKYAAKERKLIKELTNSILYTPSIQASFGAAMDFSEEPHLSRITLASPRTFGDAEVSNLSIKHFCFDESLAPKGKSAVSVLFDIAPEYFSRLYTNRDTYKKEKERITDDILVFMDVLKPGFSKAVETTDLATPWNITSQTGNWMTGYEGFLPVTKSGAFKALRKTIPGLKSFFMVGQWLSPGGGLPSLARHGRDVVQIMCALEKSAFTARTPEEEEGV